MAIKKGILGISFFCCSMLCYGISEEMPIRDNNTPEIYSNTLEGIDEIRRERMPKHIGFIMDGNRRWAKSQGLSESEGHAQGAHTLIKLIKFFCNFDLGVNTMTVYAFSTENWKRSKEEIEFLMDLFYSYCDEIAPYLEKYSIRLETIGNTGKLPLELQEKLENLKAISANNRHFTLVLAVNYGGRDEITRAFIKMASDFGKTLFSNEDISENLIKKYLDTHFTEDPELIIRTGAERRISNFLLWQMAYSELYFSPVLWPDLSEQEIVNILLDYQTRNRRFGGT